MNSTPTSATYAVPEVNFSALEAKLAKLARRAVKLGVTPVVYKVTGHRDEPVLNVFGVPTGEVDRTLFVEINGSAPCVDGWTFLATLEHAGEAGNILRNVPGSASTLPEHFRTASRLNCDHCSAERNRKETFVLVNAEGEFKQVGRNCLCDFLGGRDPHSAAKFATYLFDVEEACESSGEEGRGGDHRIDLGLFLGHVAAVVRILGWTSRGAARSYNEKAALDGGKEICASVDVAAATMFAQGPREKAETAKYRPTKEDFAFADLAQAWANETIVTKEVKSEYEHNLSVVLSQTAINRKSLGLAGSVVGVYKRSLEQEIERKVRETVGANSKHLGQVGERLLLTVKFQSVKLLDGQFGTTYLYKLVTTDGNPLTWFSSGEMESLKEGAPALTVLATVKKHDNFKGTLQTVVTRVSPASEAQIKKAEKAAAKKTLTEKATVEFQAKIQSSNTDW